METRSDLTLSSLRIDPSSDNASVAALDVEGPVTMTKTLSVTGAVSVTGRIAGGTEDFFPSAARTAISNSLTLTKNTFYKSIPTVATVNLPQTGLNKGDFIDVLYTTVINNPVTHNYTTDGKYAIGSTIRVVGQDATRIAVVDESVDADTQLKVVGKTNGDGGIGTHIRFFYNGERWAAQAVVEGQGSKDVASADTVFA